MSKKIGDRIREFRNNLNLKQGEFSKALEIHQTYLSQIENGQRENLNMELLLAIHDKFGANLNWLIAGEGPMMQADLTKLQAEKEVLEEELKKVCDDMVQHEGDPARATKIENDFNAIITELRTKNKSLDNEVIALRAKLELMQDLYRQLQMGTK